MKKAATLLLLILAARPLWADKPLLIEVNNFDKGTDTQHLPDKITINTLQDCMNMQSDKKFGLSRRPGDKREVTCNRVSVNKLWSVVFPTGEEWLVRLDCRGDLIAGRRIGSPGSCFSACVTTRIALSTIEPTDADVGLGRIWFTNKQNGLMSWDRGAFYFHTTAPKASRVAIYKNRVVLSDVANQQSSIILSGELNGDDYSFDSRFSSSPMSIKIGGVNDGNRVTDFFPGFGEALIFKGHSMSRLIGNDQRDFAIQDITPEIGTSYPNTIAQRGINTLFLSNIGVEAYNPTLGITPSGFTKVGEPLQNLFDSLLNAKSLTRSSIVDSQVEWQQGVSTPLGNISTTISPGSIRPANLTFTDTNGPDWDKGSIRNFGIPTLSTSTNPGFLTFTSSVQAYLENASFETAGSAANSANAWTIDGAGCLSNSEPILCTTLQRVNLNSAIGITAKNGTFALNSGNSDYGFGTSTAITVSIIDGNTGTTLISYTTNPVQGAWSKNILDTTAYDGKGVYLKIGVNINGGGGLLINQSTATSPLIYISTSVVVHTRVDSVSHSGVKFNDVSIDYVFLSTRPNSNFKSYIQSQVFDTQVSSPNYDPLRYSVIGGTIAVGIKTSSSPTCCFGSDVLTSTGQVTTAQRNRYIVYVASFSVEQPTQTKTIQLDEITLGSYVTGYYTTAAQDLGTDITSQRLFSVNMTTIGGSATFQIQSSTSSDFFPENRWVTQALDAKIAVSTAQWVKARVNFQTSNSTGYPIIESMAFNYNLVENFPDPLALTYKEIYYIYYSSMAASGQKNTRVALFNRNNAFDQLSGSSISAACIYNNTVLLGDASQTGNIYSMDTSTDGTDYGRNVDSYFTLKRIEGDQPDSVKVFDKFYATISRQDASISQIFNVTYKLDGSTASYSAENVEISTGSYLVDQKINIPVDNPRQGKYIDITFHELTQKTMPYFVSRLKVYGTIKEVE